MATEVATKFSSLTQDYAERAWLAYVRDDVFPRDGDISMDGLGDLIALSALARVRPERAKSPAEKYVDRSFLIEAQRSLHER